MKLLLYNRPRNPKSQGLIEHGNNMTEKILEYDYMKMTEVFICLGQNDFPLFSVNFYKYLISEKSVFHFSPTEHKNSWHFEFYSL